MMASARVVDDLRMLVTFSTGENWASKLTRPLQLLCRK